MTALYVTWAVGMLMTAGFGLVSPMWQAMAVAFVSESLSRRWSLIQFTLPQRLVPGHLLGRVSSLDWLISIAGVPQLRRGRAGGGRLRGRRDADRRRRDQCARDGRVHVLRAAATPNATARWTRPRRRVSRHPARLEHVWSTAISVVWG